MAEKSRTEEALERLNAKIERVKTPGATVIQPSNRAMYEFIYYLRDADRSCSILSNSVFSNPEVLAKVQSAQKYLSTLRDGLKGTAEELAKLAGREMRPFRERSSNSEKSATSE